MLAADVLPESDDAPDVDELDESDDDDEEDVDVSLEPFDDPPESDASLAAGCCLELLSEVAPERLSLR